MNSNRPRRAKALGTLILLAGLTASLLGFDAGPAGAEVPAPVAHSEAAATYWVRCDGDVPVVVFTFYNFAETSRMFSASHLGTHDQSLVGGTPQVAGGTRWWTRERHRRAPRRGRCGHHRGGSSPR